MIFYKNAGHVLSQKIDIEILLQRHFHSQSMAFSSIAKGIQDMRRLFSWFKVEKLASQFILQRCLLFSLIESISGRTINDYGNYIKFMKPQMLETVRSSLIPGNTGRYNSNEKRNLWGNHFVFGYNLHAILPQINLLPNNNETSQKWMIVNKPFIKHPHYNYGLDIVNSITTQRRTAFETNGENFYFHKQPKIEEEIEEIKKIVVETKGEVTEKSKSSYFPGDMDIKRHLDINGISDQVYQNIERRIRVERERRGL